MDIKVRYISGINGSRVEVKVFDDEDKMIEKKEYMYGANASYCRRHAKYAEEDHEKAIKYNWGHGFPLKPYIGDLLVEFFAKYGLTKEEVEYSGFYVFPNREATKEEVEKIKKELYEEL